MQTNTLNSLLEEANKIVRRLSYKETCIKIEDGAVIIDVREDTEREHAYIKGTIHMKLSEIAKRYTELDKEKNIFVMCHTGTRSQAVCKWLKTKGFMNCVNVLGGIDAWAALIDRNIRRY